MTRARWALLLLCACSGSAADRGSDLAVFSEGARPRWDDPLPARTAIFDGTRVHLRAVRGETLGLHVVRRAIGSAPITLTIPGVRIQAFTVDYGEVTRPSTSMYGGSRGRGRYPDRLTPTTQPVTVERSAFFDIVIPRGTMPGVTQGTLRVGNRDIPVAFTVGFEDPIDIVSRPRAWAYYDAKEVARAGTTPEVDYAALFHEHGMIASPELTLASYDERRASVAGLAFIPVLLPTDCAAIQSEVAQWITRTAGTGQVPFAIPIDEPRRMIDQLRVRARAACVRAGGGGPDRFLYAVTHEKTWLMGGDVDVHITPFGGDWTYNGTPPFAGAMVLDAADPGMRTWGWIAFRNHIPLWYVWDAFYWRDRYNKGRDQAPAHDLVADPLTFDDGEDHGNLDGVLAYPGALPSLRLKALRRGLQDRALLEQLEACAGRAAADAIAAPLIPRSLGTAKRGERASWPTSDDVFDAARDHTLDEIAACRRRDGGPPSSTSSPSPP